MTNSQKTALNSANMEALKNHISIYHNHNDQQLLFYVEKENFEAIFDIGMNKAISKKRIHLLELIHPHDVELFGVSDAGDSLDESFELIFRILKKNKEIIIVKGKFHRLSSDAIVENLLFRVELIDVRSLSGLSEKSDELSVMEMNFQAMLENTNDFIYFKDAHHVLTASSDSMAIIVGYEKGEEIVGKMDYELFPKEHADIYYELEKEIYKGNLSHIEEIQPFFDENNKQGWVDNRKYPIKNSAGKVIGLFGVARDVTKLKNVESEIKKTQLKFFSIFEEALDAIVLIDVETQTFLEFNKKSLETYGYSKEEFKKITTKDLEIIEDENEIKVRQTNIVERGWDKFLTKHKTKDGSIKDVSVNVVRIILDEKPYLYATFNDVTRQKEIENELLETNKKLTNLAENIPGVIYNFQVFLDGRMCFPYASEHLYDIYGVMPQEVKEDASKIFALTHPEDIDHIKKTTQSSLDNLTLWEDEFRVTHPDKGIMWIKGIAKPEKQPDGSVLWYSYIYDITNWKKQVELIKEQNEEFKTIFDISRDGLAILDLQSNFLDFNDAYLSMSGFSRSELLATSCLALSIIEDQERVRTALQIVFEMGYLESFEKTCINKNGSYVSMKMAFSLMPDNKRIMVSAKDITDAKNHEKELERIAHFDPLTKLPNRVLFSDRMKQSVANSHRNNQKIALAYLDLDGFKQVNDVYGHDVGDLLLIEVSKRMQNALREGDTLARFGGDEFVVILNNQNDKSETFTILNRLLEAASSPIEIHNALITVSVSVGVTFYSKEYGVDADILLRQADQAMYEAKLRGKNQIAVFNEILNISNEIGESALAIKNALNNNEFTLCYQPKVNMKSGEVIGVEALIRWNDPVRGVVYPDDFLSIVDNRPLMYEIDQWVFNEALSQICRWRTDGLATKVSVNISAYTFKQPNFFSLIDDTLAKHPNVDPRQIDIEILESSSLHEIDEVRQIIEKLHERNITVSLDDFGTGYSTLSYLKKLGIDTLKIDKSFVLDILHDSGDLSIVDASVGLAEAFSAKPLAEGVESIEQGKILIQLGCQLAQGYVVARPMSGDLLPKWVKEWKTPQSWRDAQRNESRQLPSHLEVLT